MREIKIGTNDENQRIDKFLIKYLNLAPKSFIFKMLRKKNIKVNNMKIDGNYILKNNDVLTLFLSDETVDNFREKKEIKVSKSIDIIFEDDNILVINKPSGLLSQGSKSEDEDTLVDRIIYYLSTKENDENGFTPSICNRLDINTSGIILSGKNFSATQTINNAFKEKNADKFYLAIVKGEVKQSETLYGYHVKDEGKNLVQIFKRPPSHKNFKEVITKYELLKTNGEYSLINVQLVTGASHQIRAHFEAIGHPIVGDRKYGDIDSNEFFKRKFGVSNQMLHAQKINFGKIDGALNYLSNMDFVAITPNKFNKIIKELF